MKQNRDRFSCIGVTGGAGCGKSVVLDYLVSAYHAVVLYADVIAREQTEPGGCSYHAYRAYLGESYFSENGMPDRAAIADLLFAQPERLQAVNAITHPAVLEEIWKQCDAARQQGVRFVFVESALFPDVVEKDNESFSEIWYVYADEQVRKSRLQRARGYTEEKINLLFARQPTEEIFRSFSDFVLDNSGTLAAMRRQVDARMRLYLGEG